MYSNTCTIQYICCHIVYMYLSEGLWVVCAGNEV